MQILEFQGWIVTALHELSGGGYSGCGASSRQRSRGGAKQGVDIGREVDSADRNADILVGRYCVDEQLVWRPWVAQSGGGARHGFADGADGYGGLRDGSRDGEGLETGESTDAAEGQSGEGVVGGPPGEEAGEACQKGVHDPYGEHVGGDLFVSSLV